MRLVFATTSAGKAKEAKAVLKGVELVTLADLGLDADIPETGATFRENARQKLAGWRALVPSGPLLVDDAGLEVLALDGRPGVHSARYGATAAEANARLLAEMEGVGVRTARYVSVLALSIGNGCTLLWHATCEGAILTEPRGEGGFGYDPLFFHPGLNKSLAEATLEEKASVSHRGQALRRLAAWWAFWAPLQSA
ncbi:RdgB/HAM1 family non-canonical purine NTP pyrophosphatase [bacterium]|nr:RdgB/HAM1 family non-canonical purine NTP pyrophosphatase [bacterium]